MTFFHIIGEGPNSNASILCQPLILVDIIIPHSEAMGAIILLAIAFSCLIAWYRWRHDPYRRMPDGARKLPGPWSNYTNALYGVSTSAYQLTGLPLIGRAHDIPSEMTWLHFYKWAIEFGPIYKHELFGTTHVWISSEQVAKDLLSKQASIFSDRPLITNLPINKTGGEYLPLLGENGMLLAAPPVPQDLMT